MKPRDEPYQLKWQKNRYRIRSIRRLGYYLFHRPILCGVYSRAAFINISELEPRPQTTPTLSMYMVGVASGMRTPELQTVGLEYHKNQHSFIQ